MSEQCIVVNEQGQSMQDLIVCKIYGIKSIPKGFYVKFINGNSLDCRRSNLQLVSDTETSDKEKINCNEK